MSVLNITGSPTSPSTVQTKYNLGPVKPWVAAAASFLGNMFGVKDIGGWRASDPFPDHPSGHALDFMMDIPSGNALADYAVANYQALGIKYIIHNRQVWNPRQGWHPYTGSNPHTDHVHITFNDTPGTAYTNGTLNGSAFTAPGGFTDASFGNTALDKTCAWSFAGNCVMSKVTLRKTFGIAWMGAGIGIGLVAAIILVYAMRNTGAGNAVSGADEAVTEVFMAARAGLALA